MENKRFTLLALLELSFAVLAIGLSLIFLNRFLLEDFSTLDTLLPALVGIGAGLLMAGIIWLATKFIPGLRDSKALKAVQFIKTLNWRQILILSLAAGLSEELLFRGTFQPLWGIIISSIIFAVLHAISKLYITVAFLLSLAMGYLYIWTGNLAAPIFAHFIYDFTIMALLKLGFFTLPAQPETPLPESADDARKLEDISDL